MASKYWIFGFAMNFAWLGHEVSRSRAHHEGALRGNFDLYKTFSNMLFIRVSRDAVSKSGHLNPTF